MNNWSCLIWPETCRRAIQPEHNKITYYYMYVVYIYIQYSMSLWYTSVIRSYLLPYKLNRYHLLCEKHLQVISKCMHKLIIFPIKPNFLDLIFIQMGHFLGKFYTSTLYFNIFRWIPYESWFFATFFVCHKKYPHPQKSETIACIYYIFQLYLVYLVH